MSGGGKVGASPNHMYLCTTGSATTITAFSKQQPLKATMPVTAAMRSDLAARYMSTPSTPIHRRLSPDHGLYRVSGQRSPGAVPHTKGYRSPHSLNRMLITGCNIRRTASLDTIHSRENTVCDPCYCPINCVSSSRLCSQISDSGTHQKLPDDCKIDKLLRLRNECSPRMGLRLISPPLSKSMTATPGRENMISPGHSPGCQPLCRGSLEGLNQEIETLVLRESDNKQSGLCGNIAEGRRPPLVELLRYNEPRSRSRQRLSGRQSIDWEIDCDGDNDRDSSGLSSRSSDSPPSGLVDYVLPGFQGSSVSTPNEWPRLGTSPRILAREPPDGCEKVSSKMDEYQLQPLQQPMPIKTSTCAFKPSDGSAFLPLHALPQSADLGDNNDELINGEVNPTGDL